MIVPIRYAQCYEESAAGYKTPVHLVECCGTDQVIPLDARRRVKRSVKQVKRILNAGIHCRSYFEIIHRGRVIYSNLSDYPGPAPMPRDIMNYKQQLGRIERNVLYMRKATAAEVKFGYGCTHYKSFKHSQCVKANGELKRWLKCPVDGLRYYR